MLSEIKDWASYLAEEDKEADRDVFKKHARIGRPLGDEGFIEKLEKISGRNLRKKRPGPKRDK
jgi:putative transposase